MSKNKLSTSVKRSAAIKALVIALGVSAISYVLWIFMMWDKSQLSTSSEILALPFVVLGFVINLPGAMGALFIEDMYGYLRPGSSIAEQPISTILDVTHFVTTVIVWFIVLYIVQIGVIKQKKD